MIWDLMASISAGFVAGGIFLFLRRVVRLPLPSWAVPAAAGATMVLYAVWSEYSWFGRVSQTLPESVVIAMKNESSAPWRPWSYVRPMTTRFVAFDRAALRTHDAAPGQKLATLMLVGRWEPLRTVPVLYDCAGARRADLAEGAAFGADGAVTGADWQPAAAGDPVLPLVCAEV